jgi:hypothetical protein
VVILDLDTYTLCSQMCFIWGGGGHLLELGSSYILANKVIHCCLALVSQVFTIFSTSVSALVTVMCYVVHTSGIVGSGMAAQAL